MKTLSNLTQWQAEQLAKGNRDYYAKQLHGRWCVWSKRADHVVEFDHPDDCRCRICSFSPVGGP